MLDRRLTQGPHISQLKARSQKNLRLLSLLSHCKGSADYLSLKKIYCATLLPKLEYGGFLIATAAPTQLLTLNCIQYATARLILGALHCTRVDALEAEADLMPLSLQYKLQLSNYASRILCTTNHSLCLLIHDYYHYQLYNDSLYPLPVVGRIRRIFEDIGLLYKNIVALSQSSKYAINDVPCQCSIGVNPKGSLSGEQWKQIFADLHHSYFPRVAVFTDGSVQGEKSSCAILSSSFQLKARLQITRP